MGRFDIETAPLPQSRRPAHYDERKQEFSCRSCRRILGQAVVEDGTTCVRIGMERRQLDPVLDPEMGRLEVWGLTRYNLRRGVGTPKLRTSPRRPGGLLTWSVSVPLPVVIECGCRQWCFCLSLTPPSIL